MENVALIVVLVIVSLVSVAFAFYMLVRYQHPEDYNQAWFPKVVVLLGMCLSIWTVLLFPLDVANVSGCPIDQPLANCVTTLPMESLWYACYIAIVVLVFAVVPFSIFYYEADSEWSQWRRILSGCAWALGIFVFLVVVTVIPWAFAGYADYNVDSAWSGMASVEYLQSAQNLLNVACIGLFADYNSDNPSGGPQFNSSIGFVGYNCYTSLNGLTEEWSVRVSLLVYIMAIVSTIGWILFMIFGGIGLVALPMDSIRAFLGRPRQCITKAAYQERARDLGIRAVEIRSMAETLRLEARERGRGWRWRKHAKALDNQMLMLEQDEEQLVTVYPRGEDPEYKWTTTVMGFYVRLAGGLLALALTVTWLLQIILYVLISPPVSPLLNDAFSKAGDVFPLFGVILFGIWVFYLQLATMHGAFKFGLNFLMFRIHPMKVGGTLMSSFLFNVALAMLATTASIQFCTQAFQLYANGSAILSVFGSQVNNLRGLGWVYNHSLFIYILLGVMGASFVYFCIRGPDRWKRRKPEDAYVF